MYLQWNGMRGVIGLVVQGGGRAHHSLLQLDVHDLGGLRCRHSDEVELGSHLRLGSIGSDQQGARSRKRGSSAEALICMCMSVHRLALGACVYVPVPYTR